MKPEKRLEILEAFASSKAYEFDGFVIAYLAAHPEEPEPIVVEEKKALTSEDSTDGTSQ